MADKKYTLLATQNMSGGKNIEAGGEIENLNAKQVLKLLSQGVAKFATKKANDDFMKESKSAELKEQELKLQKELEEKKEKLENDLKLSITDVVNKKAALDGVILEESEILTKVEELLLIINK